MQVIRGTTGATGYRGCLAGETVGIACLANSFVERIPKFICIQTTIVASPSAVVAPFRCGAIRDAS